METHYNSTGEEVTTNPQIMVKEYPRITVIWGVTGTPKGSECHCQTNSENETAFTMLVLFPEVVIS